jgi:hypothetical protein
MAWSPIDIASQSGYLIDLYIWLPIHGSLFNKFNYQHIPDSFSQPIQLLAITSHSSQSQFQLHHQPTMDSSHEFNDSKPVSAPTSDTLLVDFSWKKFSAVVTDSTDPTKPLYTIRYSVLKSPHMDFRSAVDDKQIACADVHVIGINPTLTLHDKDMPLRASRRLKTQYSYPSMAISSSNTPTLLTYTSECGFKNWDFILVDQQQLPVARFSSNVWATKKIGQIEFMGDCAKSQQVREEIIVTSLTVRVFSPLTPISFMLTRD